MPDICPRCQSSLPPVDGAPSPFCAVCGLQQLRVPLESLQPAASDAPHSSLIDGAAARGVEWRVASRVLALATIVGVIPCILRPEVVITGGSGLFALILLPLLTLGTAAAYLRKRPFPPFTPGMGARIGTVLALLLAVVLTALCGTAGFIARYGMHSTLVQSTLNLAFSQMEAQMAASGTPLPPQWTTVMRWPEMRAGAFLMGQAITCGLMLLLGAGAGAVAGALLGARQRRRQT